MALKNRIFQTIKKDLCKMLNLQNVKNKFVKVHLDFYSKAVMSSLKSWMKRNATLAFPRITQVLNWPVVVPLLGKREPSLLKIGCGDTSKP